MSLDKIKGIYKSFVENRYIKTAEFLKSKKIYPYFRNIEEAGPTQVFVGHDKKIMIGSNNYLGLTHNPYVKEMAIKAIEKYGTGCTGSRLLNGNYSIHEELEARLARFVGHEDALVFATGMQVNLGSLSTLVGPRDCIFSDMENHASIIDGIRLGLGHSFKFKHGNTEELEELLRNKQGKYHRMVIVTDGVFSMTGAIAHLPEIVRLARKYDAIIYLDDAHGLGVMGKNGRGTANHFNLSNEVDFNMGTFSKSFASVGGFVSGSKEGIDYIRHTARAFIFSAALPPAAVATVLACLDVVEKDNTLQDRLMENARFMKKGLCDLGLNTLNSETPVIPVVVGDDVKAMEITMFLHEHGVFATPVVSPATPPDMALIRTSYSAAHTREELQYCLDIFEKVVKKFDIAHK